MAYKDTWEAMSDEDASMLKTLFVGLGATTGFGIDTYGGEEDEEKSRRERELIKNLEKSGSFWDKSKYRLTYPLIKPKK